MGSEAGAISGAVDALFASEGRYRLLFDLMQEGFLLCEAVLDDRNEPVDWLILDVNPSFSRLTGLAREKAMGHTLLSVYPAIETHWLEAYRKVAFGVEAMIVEGPSGPRGQVFRASIYSPRPRQFACLFTDITAQKRAEARALEQRNLLELFLEAAPSSFAMLDTNLRYLHASRRWCEDYLPGVVGDLAGRSHLEVFPELPDRWREVLKRCLAGAAERSEEDSFTRPDGSVDWVKWDCRPWLDASGKIGGIVLLTEKLTDHKKTELALRESQDRFRCAFEANPVPCALFHLDGRTQALNRSFVETFGYSLEDLPTAEAWWQRAYPDPDQHQRAVNAHASWLSGKMELKKADRLVTCKGGAVRKVEATLLRQGEVLLAFYSEPSD